MPSKPASIASRADCAYSPITHDLGTRRQVGHMRDAAGVHEQHHDLAALSVNRFRQHLRALHLGSVEEPGNARLA
jgi:hypothetical protein